MKGLLFGQPFIVSRQIRIITGFLSVKAEKTRRTGVEAGSNADKVTSLMGNQIDLCFMNTTGTKGMSDADVAEINRVIKGAADPRLFRKAVPRWAPALSM